MRPLIALLALILSSVSFAGTQISLPTPHTVNLTPAFAHPPYCAAGTATTVAYDTVVTGFSTDGNYVLGQVPGYFMCGHSGRGSTVHAVYTCVQLRWDLSGILISTTANPSFASNGNPISVNCPSADPSAVYTNTGGYDAETLVQPNYYGSYYYPTLVTP